MVDGIYPKKVIFVQTIHEPQGGALEHFVQTQEVCWKDVERAFGVLQACFAIVQNPSSVWDPDCERRFEGLCVLHNMIIDDKEGVLNSQSQQSAAERRDLDFRAYLEKSLE